MSNLKIETDEVRESGQQQQKISDDFNTAVDNIYQTIDAMCSSEWIGLSSNEYINLTNQYKPKLKELGEKINNHGSADINSAQIQDDNENDLCQRMGNIL